MRKIILCFPLLLVLAACSDQSQDTGDVASQVESAAADPKKVSGYSAEKVADNTYVIHGPLELPNADNKGFMNNPAFITVPEGVVVIDPGSSVYIGEMVLREIEKVTDAPVLAVFDSHIHGDHWLGNDAIKKIYPAATIYGHEKMIEMIDEGVGQEWIDLLSNMTEGATDGTAIVRPDRSSVGGETVNIGGHDFEIIHIGKAHTATDIMVHYKQSDVLFTGDNAASERILRLLNGSVKGNIETLQHGIDMNPAHVVPGHGPSGGVEIMQGYQTYLSTLYTMVEQGYEEDLSDFEMKPAIHEALVDYHAWSGYEGELGKHISEAYLEIEMADF